MPTLREPPGAPPPPALGTPAQRALNACVHDRQDADTERPGAAAGAPRRALALNLLSVAAAYGVVVTVFQLGWLNFQSNGAIAPWLPLFMFVILFGLSMDYHVFILSRIREALPDWLGWLPKLEHHVETSPEPAAGVA